MPDDKLIPAHHPQGDRSHLPVEHHGPAPAPYVEDPYYPSLEPEGEGLDWRRYVHSLVRFKWLILVALVLGAGASYYVWSTTALEYQAAGSLWIDRDGGRFDPIESEDILEGGAWIELLRSYAVLDSVVLEQRLHIRTPGAYSAVFRSLMLSDDFADGGYELQIDANGSDYVLATSEGVILERGQLGQAVGASLGFDWRPPTGAFPAGAVVPFQLLTPRDASQALAVNLRAQMDGQGNFLELYFTGVNAEFTAHVLGALMHRFVATSTEIQTARQREMLVILEEQLQSAEAQLLEAEQAFQEFRIQTITLPSDNSGAVVGGLQETTNPVFANFFEMRVQQEQVARTKERLEEALASYAETGEVRIEALEMIPETANSSELRRSFEELIDARSQLRALSDRYSPEYEPVQDLVAQIASIEASAMGVVRGVVDVLEDQEQDLTELLADQSQELQAIPPRTIEEGRLDRSVAITESLYNDLRGRAEAARLAVASSIPEIRILDEPQVPTAPLADNRLQLAMMILFGCLGAAVGGAILLDQTDAKFRYAGDVSRDIGLDILGSIPRIHGGERKQGVMNAAQALEAFRELRIHVGFAYGSAGPITLTVSSPSAGEGKSLISSNLAVAFAEVGRRTLLIDGDTRRGDAHRLFGLSQSPGLIDYLKGNVDEEIVQRSEHDNLDFIGCGSRGTSTPELLASARMAHFLGTLKQNYDVIIIDSPPLAAGGDALILGTLTGNMTLVIRTGSTEKQLTMAKLEPLKRLPIRMLGAVLNDVDPTDGYHYYYSAYLPGYQPVAAEDEDEGAPLIGNSSSYSE